MTALNSNGEYEHMCAPNWHRVFIFYHGFANYRKATNWKRICACFSGMPNHCEISWKIHASDVLSSLSLFRVCRTELHKLRVGQCLTRSAEKQIWCNSQFFLPLRVTLILHE